MTAAANTGLTAEDTQRLQECLSGDGVAVIPTDTVYGLACNPHSSRSVQRIYELKGRPPRKPSAVMFFSLAAALDALGTLGAPGTRTRTALEALLPGPVTLLLPNPPESLFPLAGEAPSLGVRVPLFESPLAALARVTVPALQSSANLSGGPDPGRLADVPAGLRKGADLVLDGGELPGTASTVIDLSAYEQTGDWSIVRHGAVAAEAIQQLLR